jgi:DNA primase small subunit
LLLVSLSFNKIKGFFILFMGVEDYLRQLLGGYYGSVNVCSVPDIAKREFGVGDFGKKISARHLSFSSFVDLNFFLREKVPFYISYSNALYDFPSARPMEAKGLVGADLVYEFDADDLKTDCKKSHDSWRCQGCGAFGKGNLRNCPECGSGTLVDEWVCPDCLGEARSQAKKLISLLENDFGVSSGVFVNFSGSKGYHVHVRGDYVRGFSKSARIELLDYITGNNLDFESLGFFYDEKKIYHCPKYSRAKGWARKILDDVKSLFVEGDVEKIRVIGSSGLPKRGGVAVVESLLKERQLIFKGLDDGFFWGVKGLKLKEFWGSVIKSVADELKLDVDRQTSVDINKLIRVPDTIHGYTGLSAKSFDLEVFSRFDPLSDSVVLPGDEVRVCKVVSPRFFLGGKWFGPFKGDSFSCPAYVAYYLLARGSAELDVL